MARLKPIGIQEKPKTYGYNLDSMRLIILPEVEKLRE
jgi:hypothetical protein